MKPLIFVADSHRALLEFPKAVRQQVGFALYQAQMGGKHIEAKPLKNVGLECWRWFPIIAETHSARSTP
jgi:phage-related protein